MAYFSKARLVRKNLNKDAKSNIYQMVFSLTGFRRFSEQDQQKLLKQADLAVIANWLDCRCSDEY
jgi:hypothetical protein